MRDPFLIDSPTCISFSGGRTSAYMLWRVLQSNGGLPEEAMVCFANTGKEDEETLLFVNRCALRWNIRISWIEYDDCQLGFRVVDFATASRNGEPFTKLVTKRNYLPNPVARFCTSDLKVIPIEKFTHISDVMVGVRADEQRRAPKLRARGLIVPLVDAGVTIHDVMDFWSRQPFDLGLKYQNGVTPLGNCDLCFLKGPNQIKSLIFNKPERAVWWAEQEKQIGAMFRSDRPSYSQMLKFANEQQDMFTGAEESISCFCGD